MGLHVEDVSEVLTGDGASAFWEQVMAASQMSLKEAARLNA